MIPEVGYEITVFDMHREYCKMKSRGTPLRFGQYILNTVYPSLANSEVYYESNDVTTMVSILTLYCNTDGTFKELSDDRGAV
jgi:hypothetical protein